MAASTGGRKWIELFQTFGAPIVALLAFMRPVAEEALKNGGKKAGEKMADELARGKDDDRIARVALTDANIDQSLKNIIKEQIRKIDESYERASRKKKDNWSRYEKKRHEKELLDGFMVTVGSAEKSKNGRYREAEQLYHDIVSTILPGDDEKTKAKKIKAEILSIGRDRKLNGVAAKTAKHAADTGCKVSKKIDNAWSLSKNGMKKAGATAASTSRLAVGVASEVIQEAAENSVEIAQGARRPLKWGLLVLCGFGVFLGIGMLLAIISTVAG